MMVLVELVHLLFDGEVQFRQQPDFENKKLIRFLDIFQKSIYVTGAQGSNDKSDFLLALGSHGSAGGTCSGGLFGSQASVEESLFDFGGKT